MNDHGQVSIPELLSISKNLVESYFPSPDIYSLLVLALVTVTNYSRSKRHITTQIRVDLTIAFLPDLILYLRDNSIITDEIAKELSKEYKRKQEELPVILQSYIYVSAGLRTKTETKESHKRGCILV